MRPSSTLRFTAVCALTLGLAACGEREAVAPPPPAPPTVQAPAASPAPSPAAAPTTDAWAGQWNGPEGTFVRPSGSNGQYELVIQNLDGPRTFPGAANGAGDAIEFERDGEKETLRASNGEQTGMKWLAEKKDCLTVKAGEGYCRD